MTELEILKLSCYDIHKEFFDDVTPDEKECEGYNGVTGWNDEG